MRKIFYSTPLRISNGIALSHLLYVTRGGKIFKKDQNWSMAFLRKNHLDNITSINTGP